VKYFASFFVFILLICESLFLLFHLCCTVLLTQDFKGKWTMMGVEHLKKS